MFYLAVQETGTVDVRDKKKKSLKNSNQAPKQGAQSTENYFPFQVREESGKEGDSLNIPFSLKTKFN